jgi:hypothetical protein
LIYALYQASIVVIDIADCQVEIAIRGKTAWVRRLLGLKDAEANLSVLEPVALG